MANFQISNDRQSRSFRPIEPKFDRVLKGRLYMLIFKYKNDPCRNLASRAFPRINRNIWQIFRFQMTANRAVFVRLSRNSIGFLRVGYICLYLNIKMIHAGTWPLECFQGKVYGRTDGWTDDGRQAIAIARLTKSQLS